MTLTSIPWASMKASFWETSQYEGPTGRPRDVDGVDEESSPGRIMSRKLEGSSGNERMLRYGVARLEKIDVRRWIHVSVDVHYGCIRGQLERGLFRHWHINYFLLPLSFRISESRKLKLSICLDSFEFGALGGQSQPRNLTRAALSLIRYPTGTSLLTLILLTRSHFQHFLVSVSL